MLNRCYSALLAAAFDPEGQLKQWQQQLGTAPELDDLISAAPAQQQVAAPLGTRRQQWRLAGCRAWMLIWWRQLSGCCWSPASHCPVAAAA